MDPELRGEVDELKQLLERGVVALEKIAAAMYRQEQPAAAAERPATSNLQSIADALLDCDGGSALSGIDLSMDLVAAFLEGPRHGHDGSTPVGIGNILETIANRMPE